MPLAGELATASGDHRHQGYTGVVLAAAMSGAERLQSADELVVAGKLGRRLARDHL